MICYCIRRMPHPRCYFPSKTSGSSSLGRKQNVAHTDCGRLRHKSIWHSSAPDSEIYRKVTSNWDFTRLFSTRRCLNLHWLAAGSSLRIHPRLPYTPSRWDTSPQPIERWPTPPGTASLCPPRSPATPENAGRNGRRVQARFALPHVSSFAQKACAVQADKHVVYVAMTLEDGRHVRYTSRTM